MSGTHWLAHYPPAPKPHCQIKWEDVPELKLPPPMIKNPEALGPLLKWLAEQPDEYSDEECTCDDSEFD